jgi:Putative transposase
LAERKAELLPIEYFHIVYTLPAPIADIAYQNKRVIYDLLFKAAAETTLTIADDPKHLGARIGLTAVLHTWGSAMTHHPHLHMIVPGGGLSEDGSRWVPCRPTFFLPVRVLSRLFRRLFLRMLTAAHEANCLKVFAITQALPIQMRSPPSLRRSRRSNGSFTPRSHLLGQNPCSAICRATLTASPSPTGGWSRPTTVVSPSAGRTIGSMDPIAGRR